MKDTAGCVPPARGFYQWLIDMFNRVDKEQIQKVGPDVACAQWLIRNGAMVKLKGFEEYTADYQLFCKEKSYIIEAVDATNSAISEAGFLHFEGCDNITEVKLVDCTYINDKALRKLRYLKDTLNALEVRRCYNVTDGGLLSLEVLANLKELKLGGLPYVKSKETVVESLTKSLPNCKIEYD